MFQIFLNNLKFDVLTPLVDMHNPSNMLILRSILYIYEVYDGS